MLKNSIKRDTTYGISWGVCYKNKPQLPLFKPMHTFFIILVPGFGLLRRISQMNKAQWNNMAVQPQYLLHLFCSPYLWL